MRTIREVHGDLERLAGSAQSEVARHERADQLLVEVARAAALGSRVEREAEDAIAAYLRVVGDPQIPPADVVPGPKSEPLPLETDIRRDPGSER
ncbi:MAG: hypothetical protein ACXVY5_08380 [Gaiellales bacterium]